MRGELRVTLVCAALVAMVLFFVATWTGAGAIAVASKPVPALVMAALVYMERRDRVGQWMAAGLVFGAIGDALLALEGLFVAGLAAFLVDHLLVAMAYFTEEQRVRPLRALPFLIFGAAMLSILGPKLGDLETPVGSYTLAIGIMMWRAAARLPALASPSARQWAGLLGAVLFAGSDAMIAVDTFHTDLYTHGEAVMITYWLAQSLIAASVMPTRAE